MAHYLRCISIECHLNVSSRNGGDTDVSPGINRFGEVNFKVLNATLIRIIRVDAITFNDFNNRRMATVNEEVSADPQWLFLLIRPAITVVKEVHVASLEFRVNEYGESSVSWHSVHMSARLQNIMNVHT